MALNKKDRLELAQARAKKSGKVIVEEEDKDKTLTEKTPEEAQALQTQKQKEATAKIEAEKVQEKLKSPEAQALLIKQQEELNKVEAIRDLKPQLSVPERNVQAGVGAVNAISQTLGERAVPLNKATQNMEEGNPLVTPIIKGGLTVLGKAVSTKILGFSIEQIFSKSNHGNIKALQGDANKMVSEAKRITTAATSKGADVQRSIKSLRQIEEGIRARYLDAQISLSASPSDIAEGLNLEDDLSYSLRSVIEQRQALERYLITGDINQVLMYAPSEDINEF